MYALLGLFLVVITLLLGAQASKLSFCDSLSPPGTPFRLPYPEGLRQLLQPWAATVNLWDIKTPQNILQPPPVAAPVAPPAAAPSLPVIPAPKKFHDLIRRAARRHGVDEQLLRAVISLESGFDAAAVSPEGAVGLMQLLPGTARRLGVRNAHDPQQNLAGGVKYLKMCLDRFDQDEVLALAAYNAGPGNVEKYDGCPPFKETRRFVAGVMAKCYGRDWRQKRREDSS